MPFGKPFEKGRSPNPGGKPSTAWFRLWLDASVRKGGAQTRRDAYMEALFKTAIDAKHRSHFEACQLLAAYDLGKPQQGVEIAIPLTTEDDLSLLTTEKITTRLSDLLALARSRQGHKGDDS